MVPIPFRGTGIFVVFYVGICAWIVGFFFDARDFHDPEYTAVVFLFSALITSLHALKIWLSSKNQGHGAQRRSIWHDSFLFIPVLVWPAILCAICIYSFL